MKKILLSLFALCAASSLWAYDFQSGLLYYNKLAGDSTVEVTYQIYDENYSDLTATTIPETVTYNGKTYTVVAIGNWAFADRPQYFSANEINNTLKLINIPKTVKTIGSYAFYGCVALKTINFLGDGLTTIGNYAFYDTGSLFAIDFPKTLKTIGSYAFYNPYPSSKYRGLTGTLVIPNSVTTIGQFAFYQLSDLTSVTIGNSVATIGSNAFAYCNSLTYITLPKSVKTINNSAFASCSKLSTVYLESTTPPYFTSTDILPNSAKI